LVPTLGDMKRDWIIPAARSWHVRFL
jgi:hypothetical protein